MNNDFNMLVVDPGLDPFGLAYFEEGVLVRAKSLNGSTKRGPAAWQRIANKVDRWLSMSVDRFVYERPRVRKSKRGYSQDLFELVGAVGAISYSQKIPIDNVRGIKPRAWTSGRPKQANHFRAMQRLSNEETQIFPEDLDIDSPGRWEHCLDAVCIGLYDLERF